MAVYGDLRYLSFYNTVEEIASDEKAVPDKLVYLVEGDTIIPYIIRDFRFTGSFEVPGVGWAGPLDVVADTEILYSTSHPIPIDVGGVERGTTFTGNRVQEVLDRLFFPDVPVYFDVYLDIPLSHTVGEVAMLKDVHLSNITSEDLTHIELYIDGVLVRDDETELVPDYHFLINRTLSKDTEIRVVAYSSYGKGERIVRVVFENPIYFGIVSERFNPTVGNLDALQHLAYESQYLDIYSNGDCIFIAVEGSRGIRHIFDQNQNDIIDNFTESDIIASINGDAVAYKAYRSNRCTVQGFLVRVEVGDE